MRRGSFGDEAGFTLAEALIAATVFAILLAGIFQIFAPSNAAYLVSQRKLDVQQNSRVAMDTIVRQIRMAGYFPENFDANPANDQANAVAIATDALLAIAGDADETGTSNVFLFCLDGGGLRRVTAPIGAAASYVCANGEVMAESITSLRFTYYGANDAPIPDPPATPYTLDGEGPGGVPAFADTTQRGAIRRVVVTLTARDLVPGQPGQTQTYTLTSDVRLRNSN
jgi:hypothetical protein